MQPPSDSQLDAEPATAVELSAALTLPIAVERADRIVLPGADEPEHRSGTTARRSVLFLAGSLAGGNLVAMGLRIAGGVVVGRLVAPSTLGLLAGIGLVLGYAPALQLGVLNGLNRDLPYFVGKGDPERVKELASSAQAWALAVGSVLCVGLLGVAGWQLAHSQMWRAAGWFTQAILAVLLFYSTYYLQMTYRASHEFAKLAFANAAESAVGVLMLVAVAFLNFYGLCLRLVFVSATGALILYLRRPVRVAPKWNTRHFKHLLVIGAPIFGVGALYGWWGGVINSTLVLKFAGTHGMGLYSMVLLATAALDLIPSAVSQVVYPRMAEEYGRGRTVKELVNIARKPTFVTAALLIPVIVMAWVLVGPVMRVLVPAYAAAVPAMRWALLIPFVSCFMPVNSVFNVTRRQDLYITAIVIGIGVYAGTLLLLIRHGVVLTAFPQAMVLGRVAFVILSYAFIAYLRRREHRREASAL